MKKFLLSICVFLAASVMFAQHVNVQHLQKDQKSNITKFYSAVSNNPNILPSSASSVSPPIWECDFDDPNNWIIDHDPTAL